MNHSSMGLRLRTPASVHLLYMPWLRLCTCLKLPIGVPSPPCVPANARNGNADRTAGNPYHRDNLQVDAPTINTHAALVRPRRRRLRAPGRPHPRPTLTSGRGWRVAEHFSCYVAGARGRLPSPGGRRRLRPPHAPNPRQVGAALPDALSPGPKPTRDGDDWVANLQDRRRKGSPIGQPVTKGAAADLLTSASVALSVHA